MKSQLYLLENWDNKISIHLKLSYKYFIKLKTAILCGLFVLFLNPLSCFSQSEDSVENVITNRLDNIYEQYFYTDFDSALYYMNELMQFAEQKGDWYQYLNIILNKTYLAEQYQYFDSLQLYINQGYTAHKKYLSAIDSVDSYSLLRNELVYMEGMQTYIIGDYRKSIESFSEVAETYEQNVQSDSMDIFYANINLGHSYLHLGDYENAMLNLRKARRRLPKQSTYYYGAREHTYNLAFINASIGQGIFLNGQAYHSLSMVQSAQAYFLSSIHILEEKGDNPSTNKLTSLTYQKMANYYIYVAQLDSAVYFAKKMSEISLGNESDNVSNDLYVGSILLKAKKFEESLALFNKSSVLAEKIYKGKHFQMAKVYDHLGQWHAAQEHWEEALDFYQKALAQLTNNYKETDDVYAVKNPVGVTVDHALLKVLSLKAEVLAEWYKSDVTKQKQLLAALGNYHLAINLTGQMRDNFLLSESRQFLASKSHEIYENAIEVAYQAYQLGLGNQYIDEAFWLMEKNKSNLLLEAVKDVSAKQFTGIPPDVIEKETQIKSKVAYLKRALSKESDNDSEKANQLKSTLFDVQKSYQKFTTKLGQSYPEYHQLKYDKQIISINEVQQLIGKNTALVAYFYGDKNIYVIGITDNKTTLIRLPSNKELLLNFVENIGNHKYAQQNDQLRIKQFAVNGHALYQQLLAPIVSQLDDNIDQLKIIPDGILGYLPFEILLTEVYDKGTLSYKNFPYLINDYTVSTEFSATLLKTKRIEKINYEYDYVGFAPSYKGKLMAENYQITRSVETTKMQFSPLKYNEPEVEMGYDIFGGKSFLADKATEMSFKEYAPKSKIIHLSTHAFANTNNAQFSGLAFVQQDGISNVENDGLVYIDDLYNMRLNAELTVLSACETAVGEFKRGEGVMSLGRAFKYAGCQNIVMSSWTISDQSTARLMQYFYEGLNEGIGKADALRQAKLRYLEQADANTADPYFWAAFTLIGDNEPIVEKWWKKNMILLFSMAFALVIFGFLLYRKKT